MVRLCLALLGAIAATSGLSSTVLAGQPQNWHTGFQPAASPTMERIEDLNVLLLVIIVAVVVFVMGLLLYVIWRFAEKRNPTPSRTTHNTLLEVLWTTIPVIILVVIAVPSFKLLYFADSIPPEDAELTIKAIGRQWYWSYEYPDHGNFTFDANMVPDEDLEPGQPRLLATDNPIVLPVETNIRILVTASDVLHNFAMPSMGLKLDAVPGRINETWVRITREGTFYGQCSELCGTGHSYMPIEIKAVSKEEFDRWVVQAQEEFARVDEPVEPAPAGPRAQELQLAAKTKAE
ncbi:MAG: cytochrome c oxidase subunit II [Kiloniellales bacterium]|nr:cytochrome c oxidase subunit II [Kiloniellales bacterium]